ncbi:hypothetical protein [Actinoplanes sp. DH11]|uniref:hypothetical protein n=1 Tax=Actinoplanes sp. DH11 TaxID=2857011 RepID=UPI001E4EDD79|nr:hypothetical protein [Actinoplanes sp. DH11]
MTIVRRLAAAGTLLIAGTALTACGAAENTAGPATAGPATAGPATAGPATAGPAAKPVSAILLDAVPGADAPVYRYTIKGGAQPVAGVIDPANKALVSGVEQKVPDTPITLSMRFLVVGDGIWAKIAFKGPTAGSGLPKLPKKWMTLDRAKLAGTDVADLEYADAENDPGYVAALVEHADGLAGTAPGRFTGTTDLSDSAESGIVEPATLTALGAKAKKLPLEVTVDDAGRITRAAVRIPAAGKAKASTYTVTYDEYGTADPLTAPADAVKAPAVVYDLLKG